MSVPGSAGLTEVTLIWDEGRIEQWIRFGRIARERIVDRHWRIVGFVDGSVFAYVRWQANAYGTVLSRIDILRAGGERAERVAIPGVTPGAQCLLRLSGWPKVEAALETIDRIEALGIAPERVCPEHWRHVHNRLSLGRAAEPYTLDRHRAWLLRQSVTP
ncbi:DUF2840 domain-containing protein [Roseicyclus sp. F158]|uniref:DUF2840 domain-containing protein n=1 Tax=Tropicimonas omnivorans TaxID=3075590 RepID=A0ABU3DJZ4_9RHOB|nr:DUF2840 domain-containing protein [Roseicyclus sp. F158]MDT0684041.1 DUF2840 domain-containing protein [Roseicyclus sp. F158]